MAVFPHSSQLRGETGAHLTSDCSPSSALALVAKTAAAERHLLYKSCSRHVAQSLELCYGHMFRPRRRPLTGFYSCGPSKNASCFLAIISVPAWRGRVQKVRGGI